MKRKLMALALAAAMTVSMTSAVFAADEIKSADDLEGKKIDLAFMLLDPRQEDKYCWGMNYFLELTDSKVVFPMHCFEHYNINHHYLNCEDGRRWKDIVRDITGAGQVFEI